MIHLEGGREVGITLMTGGVIEDGMLNVGSELIVEARNN